MIIFRKAHPATQAMSSASKPADLNEGEIRRNPGEPDAKQAEASTYNKPRIEWQGLTIAVENPAGSVRRGRNRAGVTWEVRMRYDYGEILGTMGVDGDPVDVIVGPNPDATMVYVVHQRRYNDWENYDEDKCCVGFDSEDDAKQAFLSNYDDPRFLGPITAMPVDEFVAKVRATKEKPAMIKAVLFFKSRVGPYLRGGKLVNLSGYQGRVARAKASPDQLALFEKPTVKLGPNPYKDKHPYHDTMDLFADLPQHTEPTSELIAEHERLVDVLRSPSHEDDKVEAEKQAKELAEYKEEAGEHDHLLAQIPGAKLRRGKGPISAYYGVELNGEVVGNFHVKPDDAIAEAKQLISDKAKWAKDADDHTKAVIDLRGRLLSGGEPTEGDLALLGLRHKSNLKWFIPAAAKVFGITSHAVRPHIKEMITVAKNDFGVPKEFVNSKNGLQAIAAGLGEKPKPAYKPVTTDDHPAPIPRSLLQSIPEDRRDEWKDLHRQQHELHHYELGQVRERLVRGRIKHHEAREAVRSAESALASVKNAPIPDPAREAEAQKYLDKVSADYAKVSRDMDELIRVNDNLYDKVAKLGRQKDKIYPGSGDMNRDFASMMTRTASDQQQHEKDMLKRYRQHYKDLDAESKRKPEAMTKAIVFLRS